MTPSAESNDNSFTKFSIKQRALIALRYGTYASDEVVQDERGRSHGKAFDLAWCPVRPGTINGRICIHQVTDDGRGHILSERGWLLAVVNYERGKVRLNLPAEADYDLTYHFAPGAPKHFHLQMVTAPIVARPRRLRAVWALETEQDLQHMFGPILVRRSGQFLVRRKKKKRDNRRRIPRKTTRHRH